MDPTPAQTEAVAELRRVYGKQGIKQRAPTPPHGTMRVELPCQAGVWHWWYDQAGNLTSMSLVTQLFIPETPQERPRNALDN